jgi:hypothetical protein
MTTQESNSDVAVTVTSSMTAPCLDSNVTSFEKTPYVFYRMVVDVYVVSILCVAGFLGNLLSIAVLNRDRDKPNTTNWLLQTLAVVDTLYLVTCVLIQPVKAAHDYTDWFDERSTVRQLFPYVEPHAWAAASIAQTMTVWMVMLVTADRYIAVCKPLQVILNSLAFNIRVHRAQFRQGGGQNLSACQRKLNEAVN